MPKRKRPSTPPGQHADKYAEKPRAAEPAAAEPVDAARDFDSLYRCLHCPFVGHTEAMNRHSAKRSHWQRERVAPGSAVAHSDRRYRCSCGFVGGYSSMQAHLRMSSRVNGGHVYGMNLPPKSPRA